MLKDLVKVASRLNSLGLSSEAHFIDAVVRKFAGDLVQFPKEVWQHKPKMKAKEIREEKKRRQAESNAFQRKLEEDMRLQDEEDGIVSGPGYGYEHESEEDRIAQDQAYRADLEERKLKRPYSSDVDISSSDIGSGKGRGDRGRDAYNMPGVPMSSKAPRRSKNRGISTPFDDDDFSDDADDMFDSDGNLIDPIIFEQEEDDEDFDQYDNPEETSFRRSEPVGPGRGRGRSVYVPSDDANDMQRLAKRLASLGLIKEARTIYSIVKNAEDYLDEEEFSDDAWDDGDTGPHYYRDPRVDEEEAAMREERKRKQEEETRRINLDYYGHEDGNFDTSRWVSNRPSWRVSQT